MSKYKLVRNIGVPVFKMAYKPTIINKEVIPEDGSVIFCGNHLHVWDQVPVGIATKREIHWMAKKEYFDSKLGFFYKATGCISVDRENDPHKAKNEAIELLNNGSSIGLFPEGTRNRLKQNSINDLYKYIDSISLEEFNNIMHESNPLASQINLLEKLYNDKKISKKEFSETLLNVKDSLNKLKRNGIITNEEYNDSKLLPFKFGAVSMASKTNSLIVPFAVNGDYKIGNDNLIISFDEPIIVNKDDNLEDANKLLRNKILTLINNNERHMK